MENNEFILKENSELSDNAIVFSIENKEILKISKDGFYCMDKRIDDINNVYDKITEFCKGYNQTLEDMYQKGYEDGYKYAKSNK